MTKHEVIFLIVGICQGFLLCLLMVRAKFIK